MVGSGRGSHDRYPRTEEAAHLGPDPAVGRWTAHPKVARRALCPRHRHRGGRHRRRARPLILIPGWIARRDQQARDEPAHRPKRPEPVWWDRRTPQGRTGDDRPDRSGHLGARDRLDKRQRLSQPSHPDHRHQRLECGRRQFGTPDHRRHERGPGQLPERRHSHRAGLRARGGGGPTPRDRPGLPRRARSGSTTCGSTSRAS